MRTTLRPGLVWGTFLSTRESRHFLLPEKHQLSLCNHKCHPCLAIRVCHAESVPAQTGMPATFWVHFWILSQYKSRFVICASSGVPGSYFCVQGLWALKSNHGGTAPAAGISWYLCTVAMLDFHKWGWQHSLLLGLPKNVYLCISVLPNKVKIFMLGIWF